MATTTVAFSKVLIKKGDGASPENYAQPCLINGSRAIQITASYSEDVIPDCDNPDDPAQGRQYSLLGGLDGLRRTRLDLMALNVRPAIKVP